MIPDRHKLELFNPGFIALGYVPPAVGPLARKSSAAVLFAGASCNKARRYDDDSATRRAHHAAQLPYLMAMSRFAHYLKVIMRDQIGSYLPRQSCEAYLNSWITDYVQVDDDVNEEKKARYPLKQVSIEVVDVPASLALSRPLCIWSRTSNFTHWKAVCTW